MLENFLYLNNGLNLNDFGKSKNFFNNFFYKNEIKNIDNKPIFFCLGNPKFACDIFAPIVGSFLLKYKIKTHVFGTLQSPINLKNYKDYYMYLKYHFPKKEIIVIDSAFSTPEFWGKLKFANKGIIAGAGVGNTGEYIGDKSIIANINILSAYDNFITSQNRITLAENLAKQCGEIILSHII